MTEIFYLFLILFKVCYLTSDEKETNVHVLEMTYHIVAKQTYDQTNLKSEISYFKL